MTMRGRFVKYGGVEPREAIATLNRAVSAAGRARQRLLDDAEREGLEAGAAANLLRDRYGQSQAKTAACVGVPAATLSGWMAKAAEVGHVAHDPITRILILTEGAISRHVRETGFVVDRIITGRNEAQILAMSNLSLDVFNTGRDAPVPLMLAHDAESDSWIGIDNVLPGDYGGTGPSNVRRAAEEFGVEPDLACAIAFVDHCSDLDVIAGEITAIDVDTSALPYPLPYPHVDDPSVYTDEFSVTEVDDWVQRSIDSPSTSSLDSWMMFFTHSAPPDWAQGQAHARVYLAPEHAAADGFTRQSWYAGHNACQLIIERGRTQLWLSLRQPHDPTRWLADETYNLLSAAKLFPADIHASDNQSRIRRWLRGAGRPRPKDLDLPAGSNGLSFTPAAARARTRGA
ncbi:MAG: hypothetical protein PHQ28_00960 [Mycobacterium sp.]|nr:hypothetical protein [Mycobacterium sp.]